MPAPMPLALGYCDPWSVAPGDTIRFKIGMRGGGKRFRATLVRVTSPDTGPAGAGLKTETIKTPFEGWHDGVERPIPVGSHVLIDRPELVAGLERFTIQALVMPALIGRGRRQAVLSSWTEGTRERATTLFIDENGEATLQFADGAHGRVASGAPMQANRWYHLGASCDVASGRVLLVQTPLPMRGFDREVAVVTEGRLPMAPLAAARLRIGAVGKPGPDPRRFATWLFNGRIEAPSIADVAMTLDDLRANAAAASTGVPFDRTRAAWDFAIDISGTRIVDRGPRRYDGETINAPKRAVPGAHWQGEVQDWRQAPAEYAAIHFHEDDLYDACWPDSFTWTVPQGQRSGIYALRLDGESGPPFWVTFFVRPPRGTATAKIAFLASTASYLVYTNYRARQVPSTADLSFGALQHVDTTDMLVMHHPELGASTYDKHPDGTGVCHSSRHRPLINVRPTGRAWNLMIDYALIDWMEHEKIACDVITDDDLHVEGLSLLENYAAVMSGCHPEYWSAQMLDALEAYLKRGGRFMYLGGNGFYWRISYPESHPGMIEVRRAEGGTRAWAENSGEYYHASTGEYGGMWRRNGRPPNALLGVGFIAQGFDFSSHYEQNDARDDVRVSWMFEGIARGEKLGDFGFALGGAAGLEIDCASTALGTPAHALVVASSVGHSKVMNLVVEEISAGFSGAYGGVWPAVRADIVFFEMPGGGAVFSTGSIAYIGSLPYNNYANNIARLTGNVVRRFIDPRPFVVP
jgi:N,N-dimethylformamidase